MADKKNTSKSRWDADGLKLVPVDITKVKLANKPTKPTKKRK